MRNLKRALSLALASVMLLGMMVVGSSAKGIDDFTDSSDIVNQDAVAVTSAIGMFEGYEDGSFKPENVVTRAEMAVIICTMLYGADLNIAPFAETSVYTDVPAWAEGYVNLCSSLGVVAGVGDGKFDPNATVTTAQAVLMLCRALGYFQNAADFGDNWMLAATAKGANLGLYGDLKLTAEAGLTRDNVAELVFNALTKAVPVQYNELLGVYYNENKGILYSLTYYYTDTLGYKNFDLVYRTNENTDYGRPGTTWGIGSYRMDGSPSGEGNKDGVLNEDGSLIPERVKMTSDDEIITVADTADFTYTANTKENVIYKAVGKSVVDEYTWNVYVDGAEQTGNDLAPANDKDTDYTYTAKGATTEIYVDDVNETVTVVMINYYIGEVTKVKDDEVTVRIMGENLWTNPVDERTIAATGFAEDDYVVITVDVDDDDDSFIASIADPETAEGVVTYVANASDPETNDKGSYAKLDDGNKYTYSKYTEGDLDDINEKHPTLDVNYRLFLDPNGYVIGFIALDDYYANYLYVEEVGKYLSSIDAEVVFTDGTGKQVKINDEWVNGEKITSAELADDIQGHVFAYTEDDGVYTLRPILDMGATRPTKDDADPDTRYVNYKDVAKNVTGEITNDAAFITAGGTTYIVDEDTIFVDVDENQIYTGFENVPDYKNGDETVKFWAIDTKETDKVLEVVFIYSGEASNSNDTYFYVATTDYETYDKNKNYKQHEVYVDGEKQTLIFTQTGHNTVTNNGKGLYKVLKTNGNGYVTSAEYVGEGQFSEVESVGTRSFYLENTDPTSDEKTVQFVTNSDSIIVVVTYDLKSNGVEYQSPVVATGSLKDMEADDDYTTLVYVANTSDDDKTADLVYIVEREIPQMDNTITFTGSNFTVSAEGENTVKQDANKLGVNDHKTAEFSIDVDTTKYVLNSVKVGDEVLTADSEGVYSIANVTKNMTVAVDVTEKVPEVDKVTLTLDSTLNSAKVWSADGKTLISSSASTAFGTEYEVAEGTTLLIQDTSFSTVGTQVQDSQGNFIGEVKKAGFLTLTVNEDMTLSTSDVVSVYAITVGEGVALSEIQDDTGAEVTPVAQNGNVYYVDASDNVQKFEVKTADADAVILVTGDDVSNSTATTGTKASAQVLDNSSAISADVYLYAASKVTLTNATSTDISSNDYVKVGETIAVAPDAGYAGVIDNADVGDNLEEYTVGNADVTLNGGYEVTLNGVTATVNSKAVTSGQIVAAGQTLTATVATGAGTNVIEVKGNNKFAATAFTTGAVSADLELAAATSVTVGNGSGAVTYVGSNGKDIEVLATGADTAAYVMPGTVLTVENAGTISGAEDVTAEGDFQTFTVGTDAISIANP